MKGISRRIVAIMMAVLMITSAIVVETKAEAAAKLSVPKKVTVKEGVAKTIKITAKGYTVKKVSCVSEAMNVKIKTTKKAITVTAKKGTAGRSDYIVTTIKAKKGKKTKTFTFGTNITISGTAKPQITLADFEGTYRSYDPMTGEINPNSSVSKLTKSGDSYLLEVTLFDADKNISFSVGPYSLTDSMMSYSDKVNEYNNQHEYNLTAKSGANKITFTKMEDGGYWLAMEINAEGKTWLEGQKRE